MTLPCFPLPLARAALPGTDRTINVCEKRYVKMVDDMLASGQTKFVVPKTRFAWGSPPSRGVELAQAAVVFHVKDVRHAPPGSKFRYICKYKVGKPVIISKVINPEVYLEGNTYLRAECEQPQDKDEDVDYRVAERSLMDLLYEVARLRKSAGDPLRRLEYFLGANGRPYLVDHFKIASIEEDSLGLTWASREKFWEVASLWQGYCDRRAISLRQQLERDTLKLSGPKAEQLRRQYRDVQNDLARKASDLAQGLLQAEGHGQRLALLSAAARQEAQRLAALVAMAMVSQGEANA
jgi:Lon protease-like protein